MRIRATIAAPVLAAAAVTAVVSAAPATAAPAQPAWWGVYSYYASHAACTDQGNFLVNLGRTSRFQCWAPPDRATYPEPWELDTWTP